MGLYENVAVFCGSRFGNKPVYAQEAEVLGRGLGAREVHVIYGGGNPGLMGIFSKSAAAHGSIITAVIPHGFIKPDEPTNPEFKLIPVETLFERKDKMIFLSDLAIALPGGIGTHDENFEVLAFNDLQKFQNPGAPVKPLILTNINDVFRGLKILIEDSIEEGFAHPNMLKLLHWANSAGEALEMYDDLRSNPPMLCEKLLPGTPAAPAP